MQFESVVGLIALVWLIVAFLIMARFVHRARKLADELATRDPLIYESLGRPYPGFFASSRRTKFAQFVGRREFENLSDAWLCEQFENYRKQEIRLIVSILGSGAVIALFGLIIGHAA